MRRTQAAQRAARRRHPAVSQARLDQPSMLRGVAVQPDRQLPAEAANPTMKENTMLDPANPPADDHHSQLRSLLAQADDFAAALDHIARDDRRRLADVDRQMVTWQAQLAVVLLGIVGTPEADRGVLVADALTLMTEAGQIINASRVSPWELAAREFERLTEPSATPPDPTWAGLRQAGLFNDGLKMLGVADYLELLGITNIMKRIFGANMADLIEADDESSRGTRAGQPIRGDQHDR